MRFAGNDFVGIPGRFTARENRRNGNKNNIYLKVQMKNKLKTIIAMLALALAWIAPAALAQSRHYHSDNCTFNQWISSWNRHTSTWDGGTVQVVEDYSWRKSGYGYAPVKTKWLRCYDYNGGLISESCYYNDWAFEDSLVVIQNYSCTWRLWEGYYAEDNASSLYKIQHSGNTSCTNLSVYITGTGWYRSSTNNMWQYDTNLTSASYSLGFNTTRFYIPPYQVTANMENPGGACWTWAW